MNRIVQNTAISGDTKERSASRKEAPMNFRLSLIFQGKTKHIEYVSFEVARQAYKDKLLELIENNDPFKIALNKVTDEPFFKPQFIHEQRNTKW